MSSDDSFIKKIQKIDNDLDAITVEISALKQRQDALLHERRQIFFNENAPYIMKHQWSNENRECRFYIEADGQQQEIVTSYILKSDPPEYVLRKVPERYLYDFLSEWQIAYEEKMAERAERDTRFERQINQMRRRMSVLDMTDEEMRIWKKMLNVLAMYYHPDNIRTGNEQMMKYVNKLKEMFDL